MPDWFTAVLIFLRLVSPAQNIGVAIARFIMALPVAAFGYRLRGGGFVTLPGTFLSRALWGVILGFCYLLAFTTGIFSAIPAAVVGVLGMAAVWIVPHAYCQNMGTWPTPQKNWPSFFIPMPDDATWTAWPMWKRTAYDFACMTCVGFVRGLIVFAPSVVFWGALNAVVGVVSIALLSSLSYLAGMYVPLNFPSLQARSSNWGEFLTGASWIVALGLARIV